jgi:hypothetical protein
MCESEVCINGETYVKKSSLEQTDKIILIGQRGWVFIGDKSTKEDEVILTNASVIRIWGTTKGLGELALNGPTSLTKIDPCGTVRMNRLAVVAEINVKAEQWK